MTLSGPGVWWQRWVGTRVMEDTIHKTWMGARKGSPYAERLVCSLEKPGTTKRPTGVSIKAINGVDRMTYKQRLEKLSRSGLLAKPL